MSESISSLIKLALPAETSFSFELKDLAPYLKNTEGFDSFDDKKRTLLGVVKVTQASEVQTLINLANEYALDDSLAFSLYPISTGKNWGYGTSQPSSTAKNIILLDLGQLNKIIHFDNTLGLVTIEPGVTQQQLSDFLQQNEYPYMVPVTGAGPDCSILANAIERGYGITPYTDHFNAVNSIEGYWANGRHYQSAISELDNSDDKLVDKTFKWGIGPYLDGLFTQSNLGIATQMTIRLAKTKEAFTSFFIQLEDDALLEKSVPLIRRILQDYEGIIGSINLMDQRRLISMFAQNPSKIDKHRVMLKEEVTSLAQSINAPSWTVVGSIYGSKNVVQAVQKDIKNLFSQIPCKQLYSNNLLISVGTKVFNLLPTRLINKSTTLAMFAAQLDSFSKGKEIMLGKPNKVALKLAYWRHEQSNDIIKNNLSLEQNNCGLLWYAPLITMKTDKIREFVQFIRETCPQFNIEPFITFTLLKHDCVDSTIPIVFDLSNPKAVTDAHNCLEALFEGGRKKGFVPYRLNIDQQARLLDKTSEFWLTVNDLKSSLDPNNILSQGRYNPQ